MTGKKILWRSLQVGALLLYAFIIWGSTLLGQARPAWILLGLLVLLHLTEMRRALQVGQEKGLSPLWTILMNLLFGFTWWVPVAQGIFAR